MPNNQRDYDVYKAEPYVFAQYLAGPDLQVWHSDAGPTPFYLAMYSESPKADKELIGERGVTLTPLRPSGFLTIDGERHAAKAATGFLDGGVAVTVSNADAFSLQVVLAEAKDIEPEVRQVSSEAAPSATPDEPST